MLINKIEVDFKNADHRGELVQLMHGKCGQVNVLTSFRGTERGNHFHKISTELFFVVSGSVEVSCSYNKEIEKKTFFKGDMFEIKPNIIHSMRFPEDCVLVAMYDICVEKEDGTKDIYNPTE